MSFTAQLVALCGTKPAISDLVIGPKCAVHVLRSDRLESTSVIADENSIDELLSAAEWNGPYPNDRPLSLSIDGLRFRAQFTRATRRPRAVLRLLPQEIRSPQSLRVPKEFIDVAMNARRGILVVCGDTGSGKSTTTASLLKARSEHGEHIVTVEDPVEFLHTGHTPLQFCQREVGTDVENFATAVQSAVRCAPRIIMIGEIKDPLSAVGAVDAALTGHLIFTTLHTGSVSLAIESWLKLIPADRANQTRAVFPHLLQGVLCQRMLPDGHGGRFAIHETLFPSTNVKNCIEASRFTALQDAVDQGARDGCMSFKRSFDAAVRDGVVNETYRREIEARYLQRPQS